MVKLPKLLTSPASNLIEIDDILLKQYKFPPETVQKMLDVYTLSPETVRERLAEIDEVPHFKALKFHPRVLRLVVYQQKAKVSNVTVFHALFRLNFPTLLPLCTLLPERTLMHYAEIRALFLFSYVSYWTGER